MLDVMHRRSNAARLFQQAPRYLGENFLETILLYEPYKTAIPHRGVYIVGGYFPKGVYLNDASTDRRLVLERSMFPMPVALDRYTTTAYVRISESMFHQPLVMVSSEIDDDLLLRHNIFLGNVELRGIGIGDQLSLEESVLHGSVTIDSASVGGSIVLDYSKFLDPVVLRATSVAIQISLQGSRFSDKLNMDSVKVAGPLLIGPGAEFQSVDLTGADIGSQLSSVDAKFYGLLDLNSMSVGGNLFLRETTILSGIDLVGARIIGTASLEDSIVKGRLRLDSASIGGDLFLQRAQLHGPVQLQFLRVESNLDLQAKEMTTIDLTSARIGGDLRLGSPDVDEVKWSSWRDSEGKQRPPKITLLNTSVGVLQDTQEAWPDELERELQGFTYGSLGGFGTTGEDVAEVRESSWFINWLDRDVSYSPQPYQHLAQLLYETGHGGMATDVLFGSRVRERKELSPWNSIKWYLLWGLQVTVGFGYGSWNFLALGWVACLVAVGAVVLRFSSVGQRAVKEERLGIWYSVDMLLPIVRLREKHYEIDLDGLARYYFFVHKIAGYLLTFFVIAGLTGLTG